MSKRLYRLERGYVAYQEAVGERQKKKRSSVTNVSNIHGEPGILCFTAHSECRQCKQPCIIFFFFSFSGNAVFYSCPYIGDPHRQVSV